MGKETLDNLVIKVRKMKRNQQCKELEEQIAGAKTMRLEKARKVLETERRLVWLKNGELGGG
jgi:ribosomal protein L34E